MITSADVQNAVNTVVDLEGGPHDSMVRTFGLDPDTSPLETMEIAQDAINRAFEIVPMLMGQPALTAGIMLIIGAEAAHNADQRIAAEKMETDRDQIHRPLRAAGGVGPDPARL